MAKKVSKKTETKEVAVKSQTEVAINQELDEWGAGPQLSSRDTVIPRLMLMQPMSKKVVDGEAVFGELRDSLSGESFGSFAKPFEFIPFHYAPVWIIKKYDKKEDDFEYVETLPITQENDDLAFEEEIDGEVFKRIRTLQFFVLVPSEIAKGGALPKILSFRVTSLRAGRKLVTQMFMTNKAAKIAPAGIVMNLTVSKESNDKGTFAVLDVEPSRESTQAEVGAALHWFKAVKSDTNIKVAPDAEETEKDVSNVDTEETGSF